MGVGREEAEALDRAVCELVFIRSCRRSAETTYHDRSTSHEKEQSKSSFPRLAVAHDIDDSVG